MAISAYSMAPGLCGLPLELLQEIAGHLTNSYRPSLYAFNLTSKTCHQASASFIFRQINLKIRTPVELQHDVETLIEMLSISDSTRQVRSLILEGFLDLKKPRNEKGFIGDVDPLNWWIKRRLNEILPDEEPMYSGEYFVYDESVIKESSKEDMAWTPVVSLVRTLPCLEKLVFNCPNQFPPSLLDTLHTYRPQCKLHYLTFRIRTLLWDTPYPYEMALATSPCLHSIKVICSSRDSEGDDDFNQEAVMELVAGLAPNLKEVAVINQTPGRGLRTIHRRAQWKGLPGFVAGSVGSLTSLSLVSSSTFFWYPSYIQTWAKFTDFGSLRHLTLGGTREKGLNEELLGFIAQNCSFPQLKTLRVYSERSYEPIVGADYGDNAVAFFTALGPLEELSVSGPLEPKILDAILHRHGRTLKKLALHAQEKVYRRGDNPVQQEIPMVCTKEHVFKIQAECPILEDLCIPVQRMKSNALEVEIYKSFAKIERLRSLFLILDCSVWRAERDNAFDPPFDVEDHERLEYGHEKGHLRETLMNCAVDEALARSIWGVIRRESKRLESLKLWTTNAKQFPSGLSNVAECFFSNLSRSWLIERVPRDDKDVISIKELGRSEREAEDENKKKFRRPRPKEMEVFRRIWPSKEGEGSKGWYDDWSSIPLEV